jgi:hypothetical protein
MAIGKATAKWEQQLSEQGHLEIQQCYMIVHVKESLATITHFRSDTPNNRNIIQLYVCSEKEYKGKVGTTDLLPDRRST